MLRTIIQVFLAIALTLTAASGQDSTRREKMVRRVRDAVALFDGSVCLFAKNLDTGESYGIREDERVRTASTIKLPIMVGVFAAVEAGRARFTDELVLMNAGKVSGSGVLSEFSEGVRLPVRDLMHLMIVVSDNTATNMLLDWFTGDAVNEQMDKLGLKQTRSLRQVMGGGKSAVPRGWSKAGQVEENKRFGIGVSTPREMVTLLEKLEQGQVVSAAASKEMLAILKRQQYKDGIGRSLGETPVGSKSGALDHLRSDVGIVYTPGGRIAIAITVDEMRAVDYSAENQGNKFISMLTGLLLEGLGK